MEPLRLLRITTVPESMRVLLRGQLNFMKQHGLEVLACSAPGPDVKLMEEEGIAHAAIPFTRSLTPLQDLRCLFLLIRLMRRWKPTIVHTHTPKAGLLGMMAAWYCRVPVRLHTVAGLPLMEAHGAMKILLSMTERITYACAHRVYPNSRGLLKFMQHHFGPAIVGKKFTVLGHGSSNGIDINFFKRSGDLEARASAFRRQLNISDDRFVFCFVGRLVRDKGVQELIEAFVALKETSDRFVLLLVGLQEDSLDPVNDRTREEIERNKSIICTGFLDDVRIPMLAAQAFVLPSYREGFPNVVLQAACLGIASIVTDISGSSEIVQPERNGLVVPPKNAYALRQAMIRITDDSLRERLASASREMVVTAYDQQVVWQSILQEYRAQTVQ